MVGPLREVRDENAMVLTLRDLQPRFGVSQGQQRDHLISHLTVNPVVGIMHPFTRMLVSGFFVFVFF